MKTVLMTGTSSGIGYEAALVFARAGYQVVATMRNLDKKHTPQEIAIQEKLNINIKKLDVTNEQSVQKVVNDLLQNNGRIDILINNAGAGFLGALEQTTLSQIQDMMDVNFFGTCRLVKAVLPSMRKGKSGRIISISSVGGVSGHPFNDAYCAAKFAVEGLMESLAPVAKRFGVQISLVEPGPVNSDFVSSTLHKSPELSAELEEIGQTPTEIANILLEVASAEKPQLRYQTSELSHKMVGLKLVDPTGNKTIE